MHEFRSGYLQDFNPVVVVPPDLIQEMDLLAGVIRYQVDHYPKEAFWEQSVLLHTRRLVQFWLAQSLPDQFNRTEGERMLWVHDIPEIKAGDENAVATYNNQSLNKTKDELELEAAHRLLSGSDLNLFIRYNLASGFWRKNSDQVVGDTTALGAALIDKIDGNIVFHEIISRYYEQGVPSISNPAMDKSLLHTNVQARNFHRQVQLIPVECKAWFVQTILLQFTYIESCWSHVSPEKIPMAMKLALQEIPNLRELAW